MALTSNTFLLDDPEYQKFVKDAKIALQTLVKMQRDQMPGGLIVGIQVEDDEDTDKTGKVFDYIILQATSPGVPNHATLEAIGRTMRRYSIDEEKLNHMKLMLYRLVYNWTQNGHRIGDFSIRRHHAQVNECLKWNDRRRIYVYLSRLAREMVLVAEVQRFLQERASNRTNEPTTT